MRTAFWALALAACFGFTECHHPPDPTTTTTTDTGTDTDTGTTPEPDPGALVRVTTSGQVGFLLDEFPDEFLGDVRDQMADELLAADPDLYQAQARLQLGLTYVRLTFRQFFCFVYGTTTTGGSTTGGYPTCGQLPLPPKEIWNVQTGAPYRTTVNGHDLVVSDWTFESYIVSTLDSPGQSDVQLAAIGGFVPELIQIPIDPTLLLERTQMACMDEIDYPYNSVDEFQAGLFYDDTCLAGTGTAAQLDGCHQVSEHRDCIQAIDEEIGSFTMELLFERIPWDQTIADANQVGETPTVTGADMTPKVSGDGLSEHYVHYRYIQPDGCEQAEHCVTSLAEGEGGWVKVLKFNAKNINVGSSEIYVGDPLILNTNGSNLTVFSDCHGHYHFEEYASFGFGDDSDGGKRAFCLESTGRELNGPWVPTISEHYTCTNQGTTEGWSDQYQSSLDCQWIDVTLEDDSQAVEKTLFMDTNPDNLLCEGTVQTDVDGNPLFVPTSVVNSDGLPVSAFDCDQSAGAADNNHGEVTASVPPANEGFVTQACPKNEIGPHRNCEYQFVGFYDCTPGDIVYHEVDADPAALMQTIRICQRSDRLGGIACTEREALANAVGTSAEFECRAMLDSDVGAGGYSVYTGDIH